jgi:hypothetical protein
MVDNALKIVGAIFPADFSPSFGIVISTGNGGFCIQVGNLTQDTIAEFVEIPAEDLEGVQFLDGPFVNLGDKLHIVFRDHARQYYAGDLINVESLLRIALNKPKTPLVVKLAIAELSSSNQEVKIYRQYLANSIGSVLGENTSRLFQSSDLRIRLWDIVEAAASSAEARRRIISSRVRMLAELSVDGEILVDIRIIDPLDIRINRDEVIQKLADEYGGASAPFVMEKANLNRLQDSEDPTHLTVLDAVRRSPRQEERVAIMIRALILYPKAAAFALERYTDPASMAEGIFRNIRNTLSPGSDQLSFKDEHHVIATLIPRILRGVYSRRLGTFLYYLALYLNDYSDIAVQIRKSLDTRKSLSVQAFRSKIEDALAGRDKPGSAI